MSSYCTVQGSITCVSDLVGVEVAPTAEIGPNRIRASHIKPWSDSDNQERLDPNNGLPLIANLDALFDRVLISFDSSGQMIVSPALSASERKLLQVDGKKLSVPPTAETVGYLEYHCDKFFGQFS